jgi:hypothetical protein
VLAIQKSPALQKKTDNTVTYCTTLVFNVRSLFKVQPLIYALIANFYAYLIFANTTYFDRVQSQRIFLIYETRHVIFLNLLS